MRTNKLLKIAATYMLAFSAYAQNYNEAYNADMITVDDYYMAHYNDTLITIGDNNYCSWHPFYPENYDKFIDFLEKWSPIAVDIALKERSMRTTSPWINVHDIYATNMQIAQLNLYCDKLPDGSSSDITNYNKIKEQVEFEWRLSDAFMEIRKQDVAE